jgi:D-glycero-D-manno-heptose 1,7-bisphosphate phosphatase
MIKALFLDRDGVINEDYGYVHSIDKFVFRPGIFELAARARDRGFVIIVITNQAGIGRGYYNEKDFDDLTKWMFDQFKLRGIDIVQTYWCPHHPTHGVGEYRKDCRFRKPNPGMILKAANDHGLDLDKSILIGNKLSDIEAGQQAGIKRLCFIGNDLVTEIPFEKITKLKEFRFY